MINNNPKKKIAIFDTNVLLLFILGLNPKGEKISHPRTSNYKIEHYHALIEIFNTITHLVVIPQILLETFHLLKHPALNYKTPKKHHLYLYKEVIDSDTIIEEKIQTRKVVNNNLIYKLGFTDTSIIQLVDDLKNNKFYSKIIVVSDDKNLVEEIKKKQIKTFSFDIENAVLY